MALTRKQKKELKKLVKTKTLKETVEILNIDEKEAKNYLLDIWGKEKYQKRVKENLVVHSLSKSKLILPESFKFKEWLKINKKILFFLFFLVLATYAVALPNEFISDDLPAIVENPKISNFSYFFSSQFPLYFNLRNFLYFLINKIFGLNPIPFRLINIFFHLGTVFLIYLLLHFFFPSPLPFFTASLFAVHPILIEAVTWISGGPYSQAGFFILLSLLFWIFLTKTQQKKFLFYSLISFLLALNTSERVIWFLAVIFLYEIFFGKIKNHLKYLFPYFILVVFWIVYIFKLASQRLVALETVYYQEPGLDNPLIKIPIAITSYLELIFWPQKLTFYHSELNFSLQEFYFRCFIFLLLLSLIGWFLKRDRRIAFWFIFFILTLSPTLTPLRISWVVAERYVYLGTVGVLIFIAFLIQKIGEKLKNQKISWGILVIILITLSIRTVFRNLDWRNQDILWFATAKYSPSSHQNHNNLGNTYARRGDYQKALEEFQTAIKLKPNYADAYHNLANTYHQIGKDDLAEENYKKALEINPNLWQTHQNLAALYFLKKDYLSAENHLQQAIKINPKNPELYINLGILYSQMGDKQKAHEAFQKALTLDPQNQTIKQFLLNL
ncbi:MAG: tetratricopeptide repeat protein [Microgenomates group bacterium]